MPASSTTIGGATPASISFTATGSSTIGAAAGGFAGSVVTGAAAGVVAGPHPVTAIDSAAAIDATPITVPQKGQSDIGMRTWRRHLVQGTSFMRAKLARSISRYVFAARFTEN